MYTLKPNHSYELNKADLDFVLELAKVGYVNLLSRQVSFTTEKDNNISFKEYAGNENKGCPGLKLPDNWVIEWMGVSDGRIKITFGIN